MHEMCLYYPRCSNWLDYTNLILCSKILITLFKCANKNKNKNYCSFYRYFFILIYLSVNNIKTKKYKELMQFLILVNT